LESLELELSVVPVVFLDIAHLIDDSQNPCTSCNSAYILQKQNIGGLKMYLIVHS